MFQLILDWSEMWALIIPLVTYYFHRHQPGYFRVILVYLWIAFILNSAGDLIGDFKRYLPDWMQSNLILYAIHSISRFVCFAYFFFLIKQSHFLRLRRVLPFLYLLFVIANYIFLEDYLDQNHLSGNLFTIEAYFLLIYCLLYYLSELRDEVKSFGDDQTFWIVTGLSIYVVINFFIFLFYVPLISENASLAEKMWSIHNVAYIILCLSITKAMYVPVRPIY
ncbi:hypothetical protein SAMN06269250_5945 [Spirosoma fluviale]|uniref:YhhN-like protein n=1 Tax=Spirosoma fluviale TaxID=1597977 RepID=A0A286GQN0_9BACT|nr:hypothetical protein SAMN06269250_5945 [Spirosoma fluviale]